MSSFIFDKESFEHLLTNIFIWEEEGRYEEMTMEYCDRDCLKVALDDNVM